MREIFEPRQPGYDPSRFYEPDVPVYERFEDGPVRTHFLFPCPTSGCKNLAGGYKIIHRYDKTLPPICIQLLCAACRESPATMDVERVALPVVGGIALTIGPTNADAVRRHDEQQNARRVDEVSLKVGIEPRYKDFSLNLCSDRRNGKVPTPDARKPGVTYIPNDATAQVVKILRERQPGDSLLLSGTVGAGKTHLVKTWAMDQVRAGNPVWVFHERDLQSSLLAPRGSEQYAEARKWIEAASKAHVLVWEDMAWASDATTRQKLPEDLIRELSYVLDHRYRQNLPIVATTNATKDFLVKRVGSDFVSRLSEMVRKNWIQMDGFDWRAI